MGLSGGQPLARRYRLSRRIAVGGMGEVWQATDTRLDRQVAIKVLKPECSGDAEFRQRFHTEARIAASLNHPGIAAVHDYGEAADDHLDDHVGAYLVMELVAGDSLATILMRQRRLAAERTLDILRQAGDALAAAHARGLVHRDIKPGNILITPDGRVKLTDFGIARAVDAAPVTRDGMVMGTAHYIAPERAAGGEAGPAGDVYSLGVVGYECLAGQRPFVADNAVTVVLMHLRDQPPPLPRDVPPALRALIETALVKDPRRRYGTGGEFAAAVAAVAAGHRLPPPRGVAGGGNPCPATAVLPSPAPHFDPSPRGAPRLALALLGVLVLALGGYVAREALRSPSAPTAAPRPAQLEPAQLEPAQLEPAQREAKQASEPEPSDSGEERPEVLVVPTDYWGHRGSDAAVTAKVHGLIPRVVDDDGELVDPDLRSQCRIIGVVPRSGLVARGSTLELTCRSGK
ncbi:MAG: protein kinase domain-containing protein [Pseudonocardiaceae bacterium]